MFFQFLYNLSKQNDNDLYSVALLFFPLWPFVVPDTCYHKTDMGHSYFGDVNFALPALGSTECVRWDTMSNYRSHTYFAWDYVVDSNHCRNLLTWLNEPFCLTERNTYQPCGIPQCGKCSVVTSRVKFRDTGTNQDETSLKWILSDLDLSKYRLVTNDIPVMQSDGDILSARQALIEPIPGKITHLPFKFSV